MSMRTAEANKAILAAWQNEQQLVKDGKGTRDWTPDQQKDILELGKAYDENRRAFEGHHMKSAEAYPQHQGDPRNIQFLSRDEHLAAHGHSFRNATNGFYDVKSEKTFEFDDTGIRPCRVFALTDPIMKKDVGKVDAKLSDSSFDKCFRSVYNDDDYAMKALSSCFISSSQSPPQQSSILTESGKRRGGFWSGLQKTWEFAKKPLKAIGDFASEHPETVVELGIGLVGFFGSLMSSSDSNDSDDDTFLDYDYAEEDETDTEQHEAPSGHEESTHSSPIEHTVSAHRQRYHGEWKDKAPYQRGRKKDTPNGDFPKLCVNLQTGVE